MKIETITDYLWDLIDDLHDRHLAWKVRVLIDKMLKSEIKPEKVIKEIENLTENKITDKVDYFI